MKKFWIKMTFSPSVKDIFISKANNIYFFIININNHSYFLAYMRINMRKTLLGGGSYWKSHFLVDVKRYSPVQMLDNYNSYIHILSVSTGIVPKSTLSGFVLYSFKKIDAACNHLYFVVLVCAWKKLS